MTEVKPLIDELIRPELRGFRGYSSSRDEVEEAPEIRLDANENPFPSGYNRYPDPQPSSIVEKLSGYYGVESDQLLVTRGSDEAIDTILRLVGQPGKDAVRIFPPTYGMYSVSAQIQGLEVIESPLEMDFRWPNIRGEKPAKVTFLCSPNNPTGGSIPLDRLRELLDQSEGIVVVDEAYAEFSDEASAVELIAEYPQLLVLRTLSKAFGLAGLRIGVILGQKFWIEALQSILAPYPIPTPVLEAFLRQFDPDRMKVEVMEIVGLRQRLKEELRSLDTVEEVLPSEGNFLLVRLRCEAEPLRGFLLERGISIRDRSSAFGFPAVRISIGTPLETLKLVNEWKNYTP
ncbi:histidinol-phosphate transaminase [Cryomorphaceae bacterium]|nr:histidinol-phosphate transaminase [Cryomorphaceae bacterium]